MSDWIKLEDFNFETEGMVSFHVDTRDFHVTGHFEKDDKILSESLQHVVDIQKVKEKLLEWRESSGGSEKTWRHFDLVGTKHSGRWDFKYLRFFKGSVGWLFMADDETFPPSYLDKSGVDYLEHYYKNRVEDKEAKTFSPGEIVTDLPDTYIVYENPAIGRDEYPKPSQHRRKYRKIQNNEPCHCGSGLKFKVCHKYK